MLRTKKMLDEGTESFLFTKRGALYDLLILDVKLLKGIEPTDDQPR